MATRPDVRYIRLYTDGSAARQLAPAVPVKRAEPLPKQHKRKRKAIRVYPLAGLGIVVAVSMAILMAVGIFQLKAAQEELAVMEAYVQRLTEENVSLSDEYAAGYDLKKIERDALALGMVPSDQVPRITIEVPMEQPQEQISLWEQIGTFLTGLFA